MEIIISKSNRKDKKFKAVIDDKKTIHFGAAGYTDYTINKSNDTKDSYINRHKKNEDWSNYRTAGFYAKHILWKEPTITESIRDTNNTLKMITIKYKSR